MNKLLFFALLITTVLLTACNASSGGFRRLSTSQGWYEEPKWSADGEKILVQYSPSSTANSEFAVLQVNNGEQSKVPVSPETISVRASPNWWLDNTFGFDFTEVNLEGGKLFTSQLLVADMTTGKTELVLANLSSVKAAWNPETQQIALIQSESQEQYGLYLYDFKSGDLALVHHPPQDQRVDDLAWERNGQRIAYTVVVSYPLTNAHKTGYLETMDLKTRTKTKIFDAAPGSIDSPTWSPDGTWIAARVTDANYGSVVLLIRSDGTETRIVESSAAIVPVGLDWAPNSNTLIVTSLGRPGQNDLYLVDLTSILEK